MKTDILISLFAGALKFGQFASGTGDQAGNRSELAPGVGASMVSPA